MNGPLAAVLLYVLFIILAVCGYVANIVKIIGSIDDPITAMIVARLVGVLAFPLGAALGFF